LWDIYANLEKRWGAIGKKGAEEKRIEKERRERRAH
jgi:hypothetical protein